MRIRKITAGLLGGVMAASILAGCGGINKDEDYTWGCQFCSTFTAGDLR